MKPTGKINRFTGEEIMKIESSDINWEKEWDDLDDHEKANFLSYTDMPFLNKEVEESVKKAYEIIRIAFINEK